MCNTSLKKRMELCTSNSSITLGNTTHGLDTTATLHLGVSLMAVSLEFIAWIGTLPPSVLVNTLATSRPLGRLASTVGLTSTWHKTLGGTLQWPSITLMIFIPMIPERTSYLLGLWAGVCQNEDALPWKNFPHAFHISLQTP